MSDNKTIRLKEITTKIGSGATPTGGAEAYKEAGISLIRSLNVYDTVFQRDGLAFIDDDQADGLRNVIVEPDDVLLNITGASVARCCMVPRSILPARVNQHVAIVRADQTKAHPRFICYCLVSPRYKDELLSIAQAGATREALTKEKIQNFEIPNILLPTQYKIASILSTYDELIENNTRRIAILEEMAQAIYREWFVNFRFPGYKKVKFVDSPLGKIPEGWEVSQVADVFETLGGGTPSKKVEEYWEGGDITWFAPSDLTKSGNIYSASSENCITEAGLKKSSAKLFPAYSVMLTSRATVGVLSINTTPACTNQGFITCIPNERISTLEIFFWLREQTEKILSVASGATFKEITKGNFRKFPILVSPKKYSTLFNEIVAPIGRNIEVLIKKQDLLRSTRDLLLPKLISGELDVEDLEIDLGDITQVIEETLPTQKASTKPPERISQSKKRNKTTKKSTTKKTPKSTPYKDDMAVVCVLLDELLTADRPTSEFVIQKHAFALKHLRNLPINSCFSVMKAGPWSQELKRKAIFNGEETGVLVFDEHKKAFKKGRNFQKGLEHARSVLGDQYDLIRSLVTDLKMFGNNGLERWMTIYKIAIDLKEKGKQVSRSNIQRGIDNWPGKRDKDHFSVAHVDKAIDGMVARGWFELSGS